MFCQNCGTQNAEGVKFCRACGAPMGQVAPGAPAQNPGYNPNVRYAPKPSIPVADILKKVPGIAIIVAMVSLLLPWFGYGYFGSNSYFSISYLVVNFAAWTQNFGAVMMYLFGILCIAAPFVCVRLDKMKLPLAKIVAIAAAVLALITMFLVKDYLDVSSLKTHIGFYFYMIAMVAYGVVGFLNENNK